MKTRPTRRFQTFAIVLALLALLSPMAYAGGSAGFGGAPVTMVEREDNPVRILPEPEVSPLQETIFERLQSFRFLYDAVAESLRFFF